ncbi:uncharacterized protein LOC110656839 isoform X2 [Hevea brasiliensis]|uniref:uncharacterized protein LOC110656839 isoform X2 n=1 Tax=Hevea brasiliensis TaxID=3981 RepID=UPI0025CB8012|nr:uncharacterized protein LOC110656839 isoform X2 [Hevea brasiliensis]
MATHRKMDSEDQETLFHSYPCAYYVQSPSTISHANSAELKTQSLESTFHSPSRSDTNILLNKNPEVSRFTLSRYSSSRGSNNSFLNEKKISGDENGVNRLIIIDAHGRGDGAYGAEEEEEEEEDEDEEYYYGRKGGWWWRYCSFRRSNSCAWVSLQISWRLLVSLGVALLVFYIATKPPPPKMSIKGSKLYAEAKGSTVFKLYVGTKNKPMYGAGRNMQDMLDSGNGLPILIRVGLSSHFRVVLNLIKPKYHHQAQCLLLLDSKYDQKHRTQVYNSTCTMY